MRILTNLNNKTVTTVEPLSLKIVKAIFKIILTYCEKMAILKSGFTFARDVLDNP